MVVIAVAVLSESPAGSLLDRWLLLVLLLAVAIAAATYDTEEGPPWGWVPLWASTPSLLVLAVGGSVLCLLVRDGSCVIFPLLASRLVARGRLPEWGRWAVLAVCAAALLAFTALTNSPWWLYGVWVVGVVLLYQSGVRVEERRAQLETTELLLAQEQALREEHARTAAASERTRIARDLHDVLAHTLAGLAVTLQATVCQLAAEGASPAAREQAGRARALAVDGLAEARRAVASLAADAPDDGTADLVAVLERQVAEHRITTGDPASVEVAGPLPPVSAAAVGAVSAVVREALTNALRHAPGAPVDVALEETAGELRLQVTVREGRPAAPGAAGGMGLAGMRSRVADLGGTLDAGPVSEGWQVRARVPVGAETVRA